MKKGKLTTFLLGLSALLWMKPIGAQSFLREEKTLHVEFQHGDSNLRWTDFSSDQDLSMKKLLQILAKSPSGKKLIEMANHKAYGNGETLLDVLKPGEGSLTDTTLIRKFSASNPAHMVYEVRSRVYINRSLKLVDAVLDLAHELTHYTYRKSFNPYSNDFSLENFISSTIEGEGGEVDAYLMECKILHELFPTKVTSRFHCGEVRDENEGHFSRARAIKQFYRVGGHYTDFMKKLTQVDSHNQFPHLSEKEALFISSAYGVPYPVAAFEEFMAVKTKVCENDKKRLAVFEQSALARAPARSPAGSAVGGEVEQLHQDRDLAAFIQNYKKRCDSH